MKTEENTPILGKERIMKPGMLLEVLKQAGKLKTATRHCYTESGRKESVADHSYRLALMAMLLEDEEDFRDIQMDKVLRMCLIHDLGESFTGDIPSFLKTEANEKTEEKLLLEWVDGFSEPERSKWLELLGEMDGLKTKEAKVYKALDKMEALIAHDESDLDTWLPLEYDLQLTYGQENMNGIPYLEALRRIVDDWTLRKTGRAGTMETAEEDA